jgi:hypothetical protein
MNATDDAVSSTRSMPACSSLHVFTQGLIDACLITLAGCCVILEPGDDVGIEAKRELLFDGPIKEAAFRAGPIEEFRSV